MTTESKLPDGFVLVKKGGRPKSTRRDIAVFIAYALKMAELGKGYLANEWIIEQFKLTDASHVRKCRGNARNILKQSLVISEDTGGVMIFVPVVSVKGVTVTIPEGSSAWAWWEGLSAAFELRVSNTLSLPGLGASDLKTSQSKPGW